MGFYRAARRRILTPGVSSTRVDVRGFHYKDSQARDRLETIGRSFLDGYGAAAGARNIADAEEELERVAAPFKGFAYEGAAMGFAIRDALPVGGGRFVKRFLRGRADAHIYMAYVGIGWAMARLPRFRWSKLYAPDPLLRWLMFDGYGFHQAYFKTRKYVHEQDVEAGFHGYPSKVIDQGIGRAMWFVGGADARVVTAMLAKFPKRRLPDLYAGAGLAATYAGGAQEDELRYFRDHAGEYRPQLAQGSAFAAGARVRAGLVVPHNEIATQVFCGMSPEQAKKVTDEALVGLPDDGRVPAFEVWRERIADTLRKGSVSS